MYSPSHVTCDSCLSPAPPRTAIAIVRNARLVVGYHGAAIAHLLFVDPTRLTCMVELTTYYDLANSRKWRHMCGHLAPLAVSRGSLQCLPVGIPLQQMLAANVDTTAVPLETNATNRASHHAMATYWPSEGKSVNVPRHFLYRSQLTPGRKELYPRARFCTHWTRDYTAECKAELWVWV